MGKIAEKMKKAKTKAKAKVAAKTGKCGRNAKECAKSACMLLAFAALAAGCLAPGDMEQPARSQTQTNTIKDCIIIAGATRTTVSNGVVVAETDVPQASVELFTQTQANEGSETVTPTATSTPTMTVDTDASLDIPVTKTGGAKTVSSAISTAAKTAKEAVKGDAEEEE